MRKAQLLSKKLSRNKSTHCMTSYFNSVPNVDLSYVLFLDIVMKKEREENKEEE